MSSATAQQQTQKTPAVGLGPAKLELCALPTELGERLKSRAPESLRGLRHATADFSAATENARERRAVLAHDATCPGRQICRAPRNARLPRELGSSVSLAGRARCLTLLRLKPFEQQNVTRVDARTRSLPFSTRRPVSLGLGHNVLLHRRGTAPPKRAQRHPIEARQRWARLARAAPDRSPAWNRLGPRRGIAARRPRRERSC